MSKAPNSETGKLRLTMACGPYDRTEALRFGAIQPEGIDLKYLAIEPPPLLVDRAVKDNEFDIAEMFLALYMSLRSQDKFPFIAIPVFPSRVFRHGFIFVNTRSGIKTAKDLEGKRVGVPEFRQTAAVWAKGALQHDYGVDLTTIRWVEGGINAARPPDELDLKPEGHFSVEYAPAGKSLDQMLAVGELDALLGARKPTSFGSNPHVQRLFSNFREVEREYYRRTGIFPIMHTLVLKESLYRQRPWVATSVFNAMVAAKGWVLDRIREGGTLRFMLPWLWDDMEQLDQFFAGDGWPYGLERNRHVLETLMDHLVEQGLMEHRVPLDTLFVPL